MSAMTRSQEVANYHQLVRALVDRHGLPPAAARQEALRLCGQRFADVPLTFTDPGQSAPAIAGLEARLEAAERELAALRAASSALPRVRDRAVVWGEILAAALSERKPGESEEMAVDRFLASQPGLALYREYRQAPIPERQESAASGLETAPTGSEAVFALHRGLALADRRAGESDEAALDRFYVEHPLALQAYRAVRAAEIALTA